MKVISSKRESCYEKQGPLEVCCDADGGGEMDVGGENLSWERLVWLLLLWLLLLLLLLLVPVCCAVGGVRSME